MFLKTVFFNVFVFFSFLCISQINAKNEQIKIKKIKKLNLSEVTEDWRINIMNNELPVPGGNSYKSFLIDRKKTINKRSINNNNNRSIIDGGSLSNPWEVDTITILDGFVGNDMSSGSSQPNDHSMAISNDGLLITTHNSDIKCINTNTGEILSNVSLSAFSDTITAHSHKFDPKVIYDPNEDRFVIVYLNGSTDSTSSMIVGYSETNDPSQGWSLYEIDGHPFEDGTWSDYPAISLTENDFYLTMNMVQTGVHWKIGFDQTVIYQMAKFEGYHGDSIVTTRLWTDIAHENRNIRNMHPIKGGAQLYGPNMFFLSNRNFSLSCDSIFIMEISDSTNSTNPEISVTMIHADKPYGLSPDARKKPNDTTNLLWTNDARILGGFYENNQIHFVSNSIIPSTGNSGVYHGIISNISTGNYLIEGLYIGDTIDFGYPNISYAGAGSMNDAMITMLHTGPNTIDGFSAIFYKHNNGYHPRTILKKGEKISSNGIYRWGDYSGSQLKYNEPGVIWCSGSYGKAGSGLGSYNKDHTWVSSIKSPDMKIIGASIEENKAASNFKSYPTVSYDILNIDFNISEKQVLQLNVIDVNGRVIKTILHDSVKSGSNTISFATNHLIPGVYFLEVRNEHKALYQSQFIVQH